MTKSVVLTYIVAAALGAIVAGASSANAVTVQRYPAAFCTVDTDLEAGGATGGEYTTADGSFDDNGLGNESASVAAEFDCPLLDVIPGTDDADGLEHNEITTVNIHGNDSSATTYGATARICYQDYNSTGGDCDTANNSHAAVATTGIYTITLDGTEIDIWAANGSDFAYISIFVPGGAGSSHVYGYYVEG